MICKTRKPNSEKLKFATEKGIPAVHAAWLWDCIRSSHVQPYDKYLLSPIAPQPQMAKPRGSVAEVPTAPLSKEDSLKLRQKKPLGNRHLSIPGGGVRRHGTLQLSHSGPPTPTSESGSSSNPNLSNPQQNAQLPGAFDGTGSLPLQDIDPSVNSSRRLSTSSQTSSRAITNHNESVSPTVEVVAQPDPAQRKARPAPEVASDFAIAARSPVALTEDDAPIIQEQLKPPPTDYSDIMSKLLANRKMSTTTDKDAEPGRRRRKPLGRAPSSRSNQSTADNAISNQSSTTYAGPELGEAGEEEEVETTRRPIGIPQPSQELGWDSPGAQKAREKMILAMGGKVEGGLNVLEGIGVVKDKAGEEGFESIGRRAGRKRRG